VPTNTAPPSHGKYCAWLTAEIRGPSELLGRLELEHGVVALVVQHDE
jgi:hypothetical protein